MDEGSDIQSEYSDSDIQSSDETDIESSSYREEESNDESGDDENDLQEESNEDSGDDENDPVTPWFRVYSEEGVTPPTDFAFDETTGPQNIPVDCITPVDYFMLLLTPALLESMVTHTNFYASKFIRDNRDTLKRRSVVKNWVDTSACEMKAFVAVILNMGLTRKPTIFSYWSTPSSQMTPWFGTVMSRERFQLILKFFHLVRTPLPTPGDLNYDPCARFNPIIEVANTTFRRYYIPRKEVSVDESLIGTKNKTDLIQYLPNKHHHKWGIKLWVLCEASTAYVVSFFVYRGKRDSVPESGLSHKVVVKLLEMADLLRKGYHVFCDNFFTGIQLALDLLTKKTYITGTIRRNRTGLPPSMKKQLEPGSMAFFRKQQLLGVSYRQKKSQKNPVLLLSTKSQATATEVEARLRGVPGGRGPVTKPDVVLQYNKFMGGVDQSDMMLYAYLDERRTMKYWKKVIFSVISRMVVNAYILFREKTGNKMAHYSFVIKVVEALAEEHISSKRGREGPAGDAGPSSSVQTVATIPDKKEKDCLVCSNRKDTGRKRSRTMCSLCKMGLHGACLSKHKCKKAKKQ